MKHGEIRWYEFSPPDKRRPVLILTRDSALRLLNEITVVPITSTIRGIPSEILLGPEDGMPNFCAINFDHIQTIPKSKIGEKITTLSNEKLNQIGPILFFVFDLT